MFNQPPLPHYFSAEHASLGLQGMVCDEADGGTPMDLFGHVVVAEESARCGGAAEIMKDLAARQLGS